MTQSEINALKEKAQLAAIKIGVVDELGITHYSEEDMKLGGERWEAFKKAANPQAILALIDELEKTKVQLAEANAVAEFYGDKKNWNRNVNGWRHDMIERDLDDETLTDFEGRFSGKRARQYLQKWEVKA